MEHQSIHDGSRNRFNGFDNIMKSLEMSISIQVYLLIMGSCHLIVSGGNKESGGERETDDDNTFIKTPQNHGADKKTLLINFSYIGFFNLSLFPRGAITSNSINLQQPRNKFPIPHYESHI